MNNADFQASDTLASGALPDRDKAVKHIVIAGGGTAGWMTAAALAKIVIPTGIKVTLIESDSIGTVGVGEATLPHLRFFNNSLGFDEKEIFRETEATIKLGIEFCDWGKIGDRYIHPFGDYGFDVRGVSFHHIWSSLNRNRAVGRIDDFSLPVVMSEQNRFSFPSDDPDRLMSTFSYAYQLDAGLYAQYLRRFAERSGVIRKEGRIEDVKMAADREHIDGLKLSDGTVIDADFFVDCTGFRALLIGQTKGRDFEDWTHWLPCDRAVAVRCEGSNAPEPYTRATAKAAGWMWRIPLQSRIGNGYVYSSDMISPETAERDLLAQLEGPPTSDPLHLKFKTGWRRQGWSGNCVAVGLSAGFLEPLESTSIYLIQSAITHLIELLPLNSASPLEAAEFNRLMDNEVDKIRDFLILHYHATQRDDSPFWDKMRALSVPETLTEKIEMFRQLGYVQSYKTGLFLDASWVAVFLGQNIIPQSSHPVALSLPHQKASAMASSLAAQVQSTVTALPGHRDFISDYMHGPRAVGMAQP